MTCCNPYPEGHPRYNKAAFREALQDIMEDHYELLVSKNDDYGDNLLRFGLRGVLMRISDKYQRLENLIMNGHEAMVHEPIEETLRDLSGYALVTLAHLVMGDMTLEGVWGHGEPTIETPAIPEEWLYGNSVSTWEPGHDGD